MKKTAIKILAVASVFAASLVFMGCPSSPTDVDPVENEEPSNKEPSQNVPSGENPDEKDPATETGVFKTVVKVDSSNGKASAKIEDGVLTLTCDGSSAWGDWSHQFFIDTSLTTEASKIYRVTAKVNAPAKGSMIIKMNDDGIFVQTVPLVTGNNDLNLLLKNVAAAENIKLILAPSASMTGDVVISDLDMVEVDPSTLPTISHETVVIDLSKAEIQTWNGGFAIENNVVKFTEINDNSCGGYAFNGIDYDDGAKLVVRAKTELESFIIKPVKPNKDFVQTVTDNNFNDYTIELGTSDTLTQIGFLSKVVGTVEIESIKIVYAD